MAEAEGSGEWVETFKAWVWEPPFETERVRGLSNATVFVRPGAFTVEARGFYSRIGGWQEVEYEWQAVVVGTLLSIGGPRLLLELSGRLARCAAQFRGTRLRNALDRAALVVVDFRHWGWEAPCRVPTDVFGEQAVNAGDVPSR